MPLQPPTLLLSLILLHLVRSQQITFIRNDPDGIPLTTEAPLPSSVQERHQSTWNVTDSDGYLFLSRQNLTKMTEETLVTMRVISQTINIKENEFIKVFYDAPTSFTPILIEVTTPIFNGVVSSHAVIRDLFKAVNKCYKKGEPCALCSRTDHQITGHCAEVEQWKDSVLGQVCYDTVRSHVNRRLMNGILLFGIVHVDCSNLNRLHTISSQRLAVEFR